MSDLTRQSKHSSLSVAANLSRVKPQNEFEFSLQSTKARALKTIDDRCPSVFKKFFGGPLYDRLINTLLLYFVTKFMQDWILRTNEKIQKQHLEGVNMARISKRVQELEEEIGVQRLDISPLYRDIILKYSIYNKPLQDKMFFESMYESLILILDEAFQKLEKRSEIEREIGLLFRSKHFNSNQRRFQPPRSIDTLSIKELYTLKNETVNRALNAKMLSTLREKPPVLPMQVASVTNSPLITQYLHSPIVARAIVKDPVERQKLFEKINSPDLSLRRSRSPVPGSGGGGGGGGIGGGGGGSDWQSVASVKGGAGSVDLEPSGISLDPQASNFQIGEESSRASGMGSPLRNVKDYSVPDSAGLPVDEIFQFLVMLQRYVKFGTSLGGMATSQKNVVQAPGASTAAAMLAME